ncbi:tetratricopeptide repeat protein [Granulicella sibirica]|nr:tetratricopeptide repeat protein [Granulicella sibirica]
MSRRIGTILFLGLLSASAALHGQATAGTTDASSTAPDPQAKLREDANDALEKGEYPRALKLLSSLAEQNPKDAHLLYDLAYTQDALDQTSNAEASYRAAIGADATLIEPHLGLGLLLARTGHADEAHAELSTAAGLPAENPALKARAYRALARLDLKSSPAAARDELILALKLSPETPEDTEMAAELAEAADDPAEAEKAYRHTLAETPNDPSASASLARLLSHSNPTEAQSILNSALVAHPDAPALTAQLAALYGARGKFADGIPLAEKLHASNPNEPAVTLLLAHLYAQSGDAAKADPLYAALIEAKPDAGLLDDRADVLIKLRRYAEAETLLKRALVDPAAFATKEDYGVAASHLAFAASNNNDPMTVLHALSLRATVLPQSPSALFLAATAHDKLHEIKQAADLYNQFLAAANGKFPDEEFEARHRLVTLAHMH